MLSHLMLSHVMLAAMLLLLDAPAEERNGRGCCYPYSVIHTSYH
jgi:hypothetical protein